MEYNRYGQQPNRGHNSNYNRYHQRTPYDRGFSQRGEKPPYRSHDNRGPRPSFQERVFSNRGIQQREGRPPYRSYNSRGPRLPFQKNQQSFNFRPPPERSFNDRGQLVFEDSRQQYVRPETSRAHEEVSVGPHVTPLEQKAKSFLETVLSQKGVRSKIIFLETVEDPVQTLAGTVNSCQMMMTVVSNADDEFILKIDNEEIVKGKFANKQEAKKFLSEQAMEALRKDCFYIIKKKEFEAVSTKSAKEIKGEKQQSSLEGSKAHQMMLKMGWGGKGLGLNEQGSEKSVADIIDQNVSREGLGADNIFKKIYKLLEDYSKSDKMTLLKFDPDFSSEERAHIHNIAKKLGLKSKSEGKGEQRRITITKKLHRADLVYNLLTSDLENSLYRLEIPPNFQHLWADDKVDDVVDSDDEDDEGNYHPHFLS